VLTLLGADGSAGVTLWLKSAHLAGDNIASGRESISIVAAKLTITDVGSGRTASSP
jgi:hypothetical protein